VTHDSYQAAVVDVQTACLWEVTSRKIGNVHRYADFADTSYLDFALSAAAIAPFIVPTRGYGIGRAVLWAVEATRVVSPRNTNLGMILALIPLTFAEQNGSLLGAWRIIRDGGSVEETKLLYEAIRLAKPGGLGEAPEQDVRDEPTVTLLEAMKLAADRDMVARQYANGFADVFDFGVPAFLGGFERFGCVEAAIIDSQLRWLAEYPDSLIARKNGAAVAAEVRQRAAEVLSLGGIATPEGRRAGVELDRHLRSDGNKLNPGTTADLITACLFVALRENKVAPSAPFRWNVPDWL
jgi:triphosphoribosyl-dephospho-CoA synthase